MRDARRAWACRTGSAKGRGPDPVPSVEQGLPRLDWQTHAGGLPGGQKGRKPRSPCSEWKPPLSSLWAPRQAAALRVEGAVCDSVRMALGHRRCVPMTPKEMNSE